MACTASSPPMRLICAILPCSARSGTPGRSLRNASNRKRTCLQVDTKMMVLAWGGGGGGGVGGGFEEGRSGEKLIGSGRGADWQELGLW